MVLRKYSIYKVEHLTEGGQLYMVYLGNNQFGLGKPCTESSLITLKHDIVKKKAYPQYDSLYLKPKAFNGYPDSVKVLGCVPLKSIKNKPQTTGFYFGSAPAMPKPKKDYSKMRVLNHDS